MNDGRTQYPIEHANTNQKVIEKKITTAVVQKRIENIVSLASFKLETSS